MGWRNDEIQLADLEHIENNCEVCIMVITGLKSYRQRVDPQALLPTSLSIKCVPGRSFEVNQAVVKATATNSRIPINFASVIESSQNGSTPQNVLGKGGSEFFLSPGETS
jgi:hypothetical protein